VEAGKAKEEVALTFSVSMSSINRWLRLKRDKQTLEPGRITGRPSILGKALDEGLVEQLRAHPDATVAEHCRMWDEQTHTRVSEATMSRALKRAGWPLKKKTVGAAERDEERRAQWRAEAVELDASRFVFVDECGSHTGLARTRARAPRGQRAYASLPRNTGPNTTIISSLSVEGMGETMVVEGPPNAAVFEAYLERVLAPSLVPGRIVILDNLSAHKGRRAREIVESRGASLWFLPAYSPDYSPIENAFSKLKSYLRRAAARTKEALQAAIRDGLQTITQHDARGYFHHCGYLIQSQPL
jgi:transposase